jgi:putative membrane protein
MAAFRPLTASSLLAVAAVGAARGQLAGDLGPQAAPVGHVGEWLGTVPPWLTALILTLIVLVVAGAGALLIFVEAWWGFRLVRESGGTLRICRRSTLLPPAPRAVAHHVAAGVLTEPGSPTSTPLRQHPRTALRRRLVRAVFPVVLAVPALWLTDAGPGWVAGILPAVLVLAVLPALDSYRNLGHGLTARYLVTRYGASARTTVALQCTGVIGWTLSQSYLQRRSGLITLTATTAAGHGSYHVIDVATAEGLAFAERAVPGLLAPFMPPELLEGEPVRRAD